jgi:hypothetical protein
MREQGIPRLSFLRELSDTKSIGISAVKHDAYKVLDTGFLGTIAPV